MGGAARDVFLSLFMRVESTRLNIRRRWLPLLAVLLVGVSLGLPLFLYMRQVRLEQIELDVRPA
jgi:hypothetical protein